MEEAAEENAMAKKISEVPVWRPTRSQITLKSYVIYEIYLQYLDSYLIRLALTPQLTAYPFDVNNLLNFLNLPQQLL